MPKRSETNNFKEAIWWWQLLGFRLNEAWLTETYHKQPIWRDDGWSYHIINRSITLPNSFQSHVAHTNNAVLAQDNSVEVNKHYATDSLRKVIVNCFPTSACSKPPQQQWQSSLTPQTPRTFRLIKLLLWRDKFRRREKKFNFSQCKSIWITKKNM